MHWKKLPEISKSKIHKRRLLHAYNEYTAYLLEYLVHRITHQEHPARWRQGYLVSANELAALADQFPATASHTSNLLVLAEHFLRAMQTATHTHTCWFYHLPDEPQLASCPFGWLKVFCNQCSLFLVFFWFAKLQLLREETPVSSL